MRILEWLANNLTHTMLKRWMLIGFALVLIGPFSFSP
jgi:hypothetical protein